MSLPSAETADGDLKYGQLLLALFRIIEPTAGQIFIDGVDITKIGLHDREFNVSPLCERDSHALSRKVRSAISIVPQSPDLFEGTLRDNIDPVGEHTDADIWVALDQVGLSPTHCSLAHNFFG